MARRFLMGHLIIADTGKHLLLPWVQNSSLQTYCPTPKFLSNEAKMLFPSIMFWNQFSNKLGLFQKASEIE
jgi:hypothetical protein